MLTLHSTWHLNPLRSPAAGELVSHVENSYNCEQEKAAAAPACAGAGSRGSSAAVHVYLGPLRPSARSNLILRLSTAWSAVRLTSARNGAAVGL